MSSYLHIMGKLWSSAVKPRFRQLSEHTRAKFELIYYKSRLKAVVDTVVMKIRVMRRLLQRIKAIIIHIMLWAKILEEDTDSEEDVERAVRPQPPAAPGATPGSFVHVDGGDSVILRIAGGEKLKLPTERNDTHIMPHTKWSLSKSIDMASLAPRKKDS